MTYQLSDYGTDKADRLIAMVRNHLTLADVSELIGNRGDPWEWELYSAYAHENPALISGPMLREAIDAYLDSGPEPGTKSAHGEDLAVSRQKEKAS